MSRSLGLVAPQVGDIVTVNVQTDDPCEQIKLRGARVVAISAQAPMPIASVRTLATDTSGALQICRTA